MAADVRSLTQVLPYEALDNIARSGTCRDLGRLAQADATAAAVARRYAKRCGNIQANLGRQGFVVGSWLTAALINAMRRSMTFRRMAAATDDDEDAFRDFQITVEVVVGGANLVIAPGAFVRWERRQDSAPLPHTDPTAMEALSKVSPDNASFLYAALVYVGEEEDVYEGADGEVVTHQSSFNGQSLTGWLQLLDGGVSDAGVRMYNLLYELLMSAAEVVVELLGEDDEEDEERGELENVGSPYAQLFVGAPLALLSLNWGVQIVWRGVPVIDAAHNLDALRRRAQPRGTIINAKTYEYAEVAKQWKSMVMAIVAQHGEQAIAFGLLLRAMALHIDPYRYQQWALNRPGGDTSLSAYLDAVDRTWGNGIDTRWMQDVMPAVPLQPPDTLTVAQLEQLYETSDQVERALKAPLLSPRVTDANEASLYAGGRRHHW